MLFHTENTSLPLLRLLTNLLVCKILPLFQVEQNCSFKVWGNLRGEGEKPTAFSKAENVTSLAPLTLSLWTLGVWHWWKMGGEKGALNQPHINLKLSEIPRSCTASISVVCHFFLLLTLVNNCVLLVFHWQQRIVPWKNRENSPFQT